MLGTLIGLVVTGYLLCALCSNVLFWYETLNAPPSAIPLAKPGVVSCLRQYGRALWNYGLCSGLTVFRPVLGRYIRALEGGDAGLPPVILIHGLYNSGTVWFFLARRLREAGYRVILFGYPSFGTSAEVVTERFDACMARVETESPLYRPCLVAHSLGGLIVRNWLRRPGNAERLSGVITLGTPHKGSKFAALALGSMARATRIRSDLVEGVQPDATPPGLCVSLASPCDEAVLPPENLMPPASWELVVTHPAGHFGMLFSPRVAATILENLKSRVMPVGRADASDA